MFVILSFLSNTVFNFVIGLMLARFLGPDQYGRFALAVAIATGLQTAAFDWARVAASRFFAQTGGTEDPHLRPTIEAALAILAALVGGVALLAIALRLALPLPSLTMGLAVALAIVNGAFDYWTALIRARFLDAAYARLILTKNLLSACLTLGGAFWFGSAGVALAGLGFSMGGGALAVRGALATGAAPRGRAEPALARRLLGYALPVVMANLLYQSLPLVDRLLIARDRGFALSGQFSLAYDIGVRIVAAIGSALDVLLFQIAVRADALQGSDEARRQIGINIGIVLAVLAPACAGLWIVVPSFEIVAVPPEFRGAFATYLRLLLPGLFCYGILFFALHPLFQIAQRTRPLVVVATAAALLNLILVAGWPASGDAAPYAHAQVIALGVGLALLAAWACRVAPVRLRSRDLVGTGVATAAMLAACGPLTGFDPGVATLVVQVGVGGVVYGVLALALDLCGLRTGLRSKLRRDVA
ncbi:lipopolysaccharide biosynthesis protein [Lichenihabitans sp. Uapishka_5]|uniref:lipopolysaccharide biosynthesis protein n=1 Tax=Lichenihabitans sp. Uapishka_5 TaxID=3037302 RepID=UPI0029E80828|nr:lipopolysaccharide biosynthesis protein [Lichenihabitans sp. Uapishka_5]MDX7952238.1 lipopolysaccharide biosynthesis protein [Lichenihabitans sp. Uapishka_5]